MPVLNLSRTSAPVISVENLVHRYENRTALNGVSFDVRPAELFGLLGPNGSGKTTLFRILSTLMIPTSGRALVMGCDAAQDAREPPPPDRRGVSGAERRPQTHRVRKSVASGPSLRPARISAEKAHRRNSDSRRPGRPRQGTRRNFFRRHAAPHRTRERPAASSRRFAAR